MKINTPDKETNVNVASPLDAMTLAQRWKQIFREQLILGTPPTVKPEDVTREAIRSTGIEEANVEKILAILLPEVHKKAAQLLDLPADVSGAQPAAPAPVPTRPMGRETHPEQLLLEASRELLGKKIKIPKGNGFVYAEILEIEVWKHVGENHRDSFLGKNRLPGSLFIKRVFTAPNLTVVHDPMATSVMRIVKLRDRQGQEMSVKDFLTTNGKGRANFDLDTVLDFDGQSPQEAAMTFEDSDEEFETVETDSPEERAKHGSLKFLKRKAKRS